MADWNSLEKKVDPNFDGSLWQKLGYEARLCPVCGAHLHEGICLNACHLSTSARERFVSLMREAAIRVQQS
jgi:hypothetical protein